MPQKVSMVQESRGVWESAVEKENELLKSTEGSAHNEDTIYQLFHIQNAVMPLTLPNFISPHRRSKWKTYINNGPKANWPSAHTFICEGMAYY